MTLPLSTSTRGDATVLTVGGSIDVHTAPALRSAIDEILVGVATARLVVDLDGVDFLDSSALGTLVGAGKAIAERDGTLRIVCTRPKLLRLFQITRLDEVFSIVASIDEALAPA